MSLTRRLVPPAAAYDADAEAYFAAMTTQPDATRKGLIDALIVGLKADGVWSLLDWLLLLASHDSQSALLDARTPSKAATAVNTPTFTADRGFTGDGISAYVDLGEAHNASGNLWAQNSATFGVWCNQQNGGTGLIAQCGNTGNDRSVIRARSTAGNETFNINDASASALQANTGSRTGHRSAMRDSSTNKVGYYNGAKVTTLSVTSSAVSTTNATVLRASSAYSPDRIAAYWTGGAMTDDQVLAMHNRLNTYLTAIGAN